MTVAGFREESGSELDLDGRSGRVFLRVLLHLTMHEYPPLVSGALHLLFRHFSQRLEVLRSYTQVSSLSLSLSQLLKVLRSYTQVSSLSRSLSPLKAGGVPMPLPARSPDLAATMVSRFSPYALCQCSDCSALRLSFCWVTSSL